MLITKVELKNIKNHTEASFSFQPGVVAICGPNGSGKTTILEAIAWALFDHLDYKRDDFLKRGTKRGQVVISFLSNLDGREYVVTRDTAGGYFVYDPVTKTRLVEQKNQVVPWLEQHIGVEPGSDLSALFKTTIGVPQGTFTWDFTLSPTNRKNVFDQILKVGEYRDASDSLRGTLKVIDGRVTEVEKQAAEAEGELKAWDETHRQHDELTRQLTASRDEFANAESARDRARQESESFAAIRREVEATAGAIERLRVRLNLKKDALTTAREAADQAREAARIVETARHGYENYIEAVARLNELEKSRQTRDALRARAEAFERELFETISRLTRSKDRLGDVAEAKRVLAGLEPLVIGQEEIETRIARLREDRGASQGLHLSLASIDRELERLRLRYSELSRQSEKAQALRQKAERYDELETARNRVDEKIKNFDLARAGFNLRKEKLDGLRKENDRIWSELKRFQVEVDRLKPLAEIAAGLPEMEALRQAESDRLSRLRAEVARDDEMIAALESGGICPLLTERCLNLKPDESLDERFKSGLDARKQEIKALDHRLDRMAEDILRGREAAAEISKLPHLLPEIERNAGLIESHRVQIETVEKEIASMEDMSGDTADKLRSERREIDAALREARDAQRVLHQAEGMQGEIDQIRNEGESKRAERDDLDARIKALGDIEAQLAEAEASLRALDDPRSRARACQQTIAKEVEWRREVEVAEVDRDNIQSRLESCRAELQAWLSLDADLSVAARAREDNECDYQAFIAHEKIAGAVTAREQEAADLAREMDETDRALQESLTRLNDLEGSYDSEAHLRAQTDSEKWRERATQLAAQISHTEQQLGLLKSRLDYLESVRTRLRELHGEIEKTRRLRDVADFIRDILHKAAPFITESYLYSISHEANQLYREITGRHDVSLQWTRDYEILLEEEGRERPFISLSGGEQMAAALSVRLALLKELSEVNLAFFDEPTTNMDEERRRNLAQQIGRIKDFQQLFVISHDDSFEGYTDQIVMLDGATASDRLEPEKKLSHE